MLSCSCFETAVSRGAVAVTEPYDETDEHGTVRIARVRTYGEVVHSFIDKSKYTGVFLPGYKPYTVNDPLQKIL